MQSAGIKPTFYICQNNKVIFHFHTPSFWKATTKASLNHPKNDDSQKISFFYGFKIPRE